MPYLTDAYYYYYYYYIITLFELQRQCAVQVFVSNIHEDAKYIDTEGVEKLCEINSSISEKGVKIMFKFGDTELLIFVRDRKTKAVQRVIVEYDKNK